MKILTWSRRKFMKIIGGSTASLMLWLNVGCGNKVKNRYKWRFITDEEARLLDALTREIIPTDEDPGAHEANVVNFIDKQLVYHYNHLQELYRTNLKNLDSACQAIYNESFENLPAETRITFLEEMEAGAIKTNNWASEDQKRFFSTLVSHTMQGFYGSPRHGGNKDYVSYRMLGLAYPDIIGQNRYQNLNWRVYPD